MTTTLSHLFPSKLFNLLRTTSALRCHFTTLSQPLDDSSVIAKAVKLLQSSTSQELQDANHTLNNLLFLNTSFPSQRVVLQIARRLPSSSESLKFLHYLKHNATSAPHANSLLSSVFEVVFKLAVKECDSETNLYKLYKLSREWNVPLTLDTATLLLRCFERCGLSEEAVSLFSEVERKNVNICNVIFDLFLENGRIEDVIKVLDEMLQMPSGSDLRPNHVTRDIVFGYFLDRKTDLCGENVSTLVLKLCECQIFPTSVQLTKLITKLCKSRETDVAWDLFWRLLKLGVNVEVASWNALLAGLGRDWDFKRMNELFGEMVALGIRPDVVTFRILINHMCKSRRIDEAMEMFQRMTKIGVSDGNLVEPDVTIYNMLIDGLCKVGRQEEGLSLMEEMKSQEGCAPNSVTYNCLIDGFCKTGAIEKGQELFEDMKKDKVLPNTITLNSLISGMCSVGSTNSALQFFDEMQEKGLRGNGSTYSILIDAFLFVNNLNKAMELFDRMIKEGCVADATVYYRLISGLSQDGRMADATCVLSEMKEAGFCPNMACYNDLIRGFCSRMMLNKAYEILDEMKNNGVRSDVVAYNNALISSFEEKRREKLC